MLLHLPCLIDEFILSYLIVFLKWGVSRLTEGAKRNEEASIGKKGSGREGYRGN